VLIALQVRRFRCLRPECPAVTFAEQAEGVTSRYCRRSVPLAAMLAGFGLELAGRAGARLALLPGIAVHPSTVLRLVTALPGPGVAGAPEVLGIHVQAAIQWQKISAGDWAAYAADVSRRSGHTRPSHTSTPSCSPPDVP
jgi:hypothetical protein